MKKIVRVTGHEFNCLPGHAVVEAKGTGSSVCAALRSAVQTMLQDSILRGRHITSFKIIVFASDEVKGAKDAGN